MKKYFVLTVSLLFLFSCKQEDETNIPDAVLIRSIIPTHGEELMLQRTHKQKVTPEITCGPGRVTKALGLTVADNGCSLTDDKLWIEDRGLLLPEHNIINTPRIGVDYAGEDAKLPYRFLIPGNQLP